MAKAITGAALLVGAVALDFVSAGALTPLTVAMANGLYDAAVGLALVGASMVAGSIATALTSNRGMGITTRQAAPYQQVIYGMRRVGGISVYESTTGSHHDQYNYVIVFAGHEVDSFVNLYLDGRQVHWLGSGVGWGVRNGIGFGGIADNGTYTGPDGNQYNFGGTGHSGIYCEARYGDQAATDYISGLTANDPNWAPDGSGNYPSLKGCAYVYLKIEFNSTLFPNPPEIRLTVKGKNDILDVRSSSRGWTCNPALIAADIITDTEFGIGDVEAFQDSGSLAQLVAAANICDESVEVAALSTSGTVYESRYTAHHVYDAGTAPGAALDVVLATIGARISQPGGEWYIYPAAWLGPSFAFDENTLAGKIRWNPRRSQSELFNRIRGVYTAPTYPFNVAGNLYDQNGFYNGMLQNNFPFAYQQTNYPPYAQDPQHGYSADQFLESDSGALGAWSSGTTYGLGDVVTEGTGLSLVIYKSLVAGNVGNDPAASPTKWVPYENLLPGQLDLTAVLSVTQAQRLAKISLMRNRQQGSGSFPMMLGAFVMQCCDVMEFTFAALGWTSKNLEVLGVNSAIQPGDDETPPVDTLMVTVAESDPSVYDWSPSTEELTVYDVAATPTQWSNVPAPPTGMSLLSGAGTALVGLDGVVTPRVEVQWTPPADVLATQIQVQYQAQPISGSPGPWIDAGRADAASTSFYVTGPVQGSIYGFRIRSIRGNSNQTSVWVEIDGYTVSITLSVLTQLAVAQNALRALALSGGTAEIIVSPFTVLVGMATETCLPAGPYTITGLAQRTLYYVYYVDPTFAGGAITPIATTNPADYLGKLGYFLIGTIVTPASGSSGGGGGGGGGGGSSATYSPTSFQDMGSYTTLTPAGPYQGSSATVSANQVSGGVGDCSWGGFPAVTPGGTLKLYVTIDSITAVGGAYPGGCGITLKGQGGVTIVDDSISPITPGTFSQTLGSGTDLSTVFAELVVNPTTVSFPGFTGEVDVVVSDIYIGP